MRIEDPSMREKVAKAVSDPDVRRILEATTVVAKSVADISEELGIPLRTVYRLVEELNGLGLVVGETSALIEGGGKFMLYRSMVKTVMIKYEGNVFEVDLLPNEGILGRFMRFWSYMGGRR